MPTNTSWVCYKAEQCCNGRGRDSGRYGICVMSWGRHLGLAARVPVNVIGYDAGDVQQMGNGIAELRITVRPGKESDGLLKQGLERQKDGSVDAGRFVQEQCSNVKACNGVGVHNPTEGVGARLRLTREEGVG